LKGWPDDIRDCDPALRPFFQFHGELTVQGHLIFRGSCLFVPSALRKEIMSLAHSSHIGLGGCRYGVPDSVVTDNGPCFALSEFSKFASKWNFQHVTSSPRYPQSNGKAENAVCTVKRLFTECRAAGVSEFQALLDWRNTPSEGLDASPVQRFFGRRCKTLLPATEALLRPRFSLTTDAKKLRAQKEKQKKFYNRGKRPLAPLKPGEAVRVRSPRGTWKQGICLREVAPRSYDVQVNGEVRHRNRKDISRANE